MFNSIILEDVVEGYQADRRNAANLDRLIKANKVDNLRIQERIGGLLIAFSQKIKDQPKADLSPQMR